MLLSRPPPPPRQERLLDALAIELPNKVVYTPLVNESLAALVSPDFRVRRAAVTVLAIIAEVRWVICVGAPAALAIGMRACVRAGVRDADAP